jgi:hypothetical protein
VVGLQRLGVTVPGVYRQPLYRQCSEPPEHTALVDRAACDCAREAVHIYLGTQDGAQAPVVRTHHYKNWKLPSSKFLKGQNNFPNCVSEVIVYVCRISITDINMKHVAGWVGGGDAVPSVLLSIRNDNTREPLPEQQLMLLI